MTREEALNILHNASVYHPDYLDAFNMAIKALQQEPCEDAVSRQAVIDTIYHECSGENLDIDFAKVLLLQRKIKALPSVNPQKIGHWIPRYDIWGDKATTIVKTISGYQCSECNCESEKYNFCPNCGAKMIEQQESEVDN